MMQYQQLLRLVLEKASLSRIAPAQAPAPCSERKPSNGYYFDQHQK